MINTLNCKQNELVKLDLTYSTSKGLIREIIYAEFISNDFSKDNPEYLESITLKQIINIYDYLIKGSEHSLVPRTINRYFLNGQHSSISGNSNISNI